VSLGRTAFERIAADPDALADLDEVRLIAEDDEGSQDWEALDYVGNEAFQRATGIDDEEAYDDLLDAAGFDSLLSPDPAGEDWDFEDPAQCARRLPRLTALFPVRALESSGAIPPQVVRSYLDAAEQRLLSAGAEPPLPTAGPPAAAAAMVSLVAARERMRADRAANADGS